MNEKRAASMCPPLSSAWPTRPRLRKASSRGTELALVTMHRPHCSQAARTSCDGSSLGIVEVAASLACLILFVAAVQLQSQYRNTTVTVPTVNHPKRNNRRRYIASPRATAPEATWGEKYYSGCYITGVLTCCSNLVASLDGS